MRGDVILILNTIETILLAATLIVLIIYTRETFKLRKETTKQTELQLRPFVILISNEQKSAYYFKNIGNGTAMKVNLKSIVLKDIQYDFWEKDYLNPLELYALRLKKVNNENVTPCSPYKYFQGESQEFSFTIEYENINNKKYKTNGIIKGPLVTIKNTE